MFYHYTIDLLSKLTRLKTYEETLVSLDCLLVGDEGIGPPIVRYKLTFLPLK